MKKFLSLLLIFNLVFYIVGCDQKNDILQSENNSSNDSTVSNNNCLSEEEIRTIIQSEIQKNVNSNASDVFVVGQKLKNVCGDSFKMPIEEHKDCFVQITSITATNKKEADIDNLNDYLTDTNPLTENDYRYFKYIYDLKITGKVDKKFKDNKIWLHISLDGGEAYVKGELNSGREYCGIGQISADGTFKVEALVYSDIHAKSININWARFY